VSERSKENTAIKRDKFRKDLRINACKKNPNICFLHPSKLGDRHAHQYRKLGGKNLNARLTADTANTANTADTML
jgi:hypothetical protein